MKRYNGYNGASAQEANILWSWWKGDALPPLAALPGFSFEEITDPPIIEKFMYIAQRESQQRLATGHRAYLARVNGQPAAYGWSAINQGAFGTPSVTLHIPPSNHYLYHFVTLLPWRGKGVYPHLLQAIINDELKTDDRFWIIHRQVNKASQRGIEKAGFQLTATIQTAGDLQLLFTPADNTTRARAAADMLDISIT